MRNVRLFAALGAVSLLVGASFAALSAGAAQSDDKASSAAKSAIDPRIAKAAGKKRVLTDEEQYVIRARIAEMRKESYTPGLREKTPPADWINISYHGVPYDANYEPILVDRETAWTIQQSLFDIYLQSADPSALAKLADGDLAGFFNEQKADDVGLVVRSTILEGMTDTLSKDIAELYAWRHGILQREIRRLLDGAFLQLHPDVLNRLLRGQFRLPPGGWLQPPEPTTAYMDACEGEEVPIPPDFPGPEWKNQGEQIVEFISAQLLDDAGVSRDGRTEVYAYRGRTGVCMALPRAIGDVYSRGGNVRLLGVICQSETTGKACFWDNIDRTTGRTITGPSAFLDIKALQDGTNLNENCTSCHRGGNVFNVHPNTPVDLTRPSSSPVDGRPYDIHPGTILVPGTTYSSIRYTPMGSNRFGPWTNPGPLGLTPSGGCTGCHEIADTANVYYGHGLRENGYCGMLRTAATSTMPNASSPAGWPSAWGGAFTAHTTFLKARCRN
jgi:hypothetical protein